MAHPKGSRKIEKVEAREGSLWQRLIEEEEGRINDGRDRKKWRPEKKEKREVLLLLLICCFDSFLEFGRCARLLIGFGVKSPRSPLALIYHLLFTIFLSFFFENLLFLFVFLWDLFVLIIVHHIRPWLGWFKWNRTYPS